MISFRFKLINLWSNKSKDTNQYKTYLCSYGKIKWTKFKFWEMEIQKDSPYNFFNIELDTCWRGRDHSGIIFEIGIYKWSLCAQIYDSRHWNYVTNTWEKFIDQDKQDLRKNIVDKQ